MSEKFKNQPRPLLRPRSINFRQHFRNLSRKTVPLIVKFLLSKIFLDMFSLLNGSNCTENSKLIFPERNLRGLVPSFYIHVSVSDLYVHIFTRSVRLLVFCSIKFADLAWEYINCLLIHECRNWKRDRAISDLGIFVSNFRYSAFALHGFNNFLLFEYSAEMFFSLTVS